MNPGLHHDDAVYKQNNAGSAETESTRVKVWEDEVSGGRHGTKFQTWHSYETGEQAQGSSLEFEIGW